MAQQKILLVEDNVINLKFAMQLLKSRGYNVLGVEEGKKALAEAKGFRPDLILMDLFLKDTHGFALVKQLKADPQLTGTPIVALTASVFDEDRKHAMDAGCDDYVKKPIDPDNLVEVMEKLLRK